MTYSSVIGLRTRHRHVQLLRVQYTSQYLAFKPYELATNEPAATGAACNVNTYACLEYRPTRAATKRCSTTLGSGSFPFMDFGNKLDAGRRRLR